MAGSAGDRNPLGPNTLFVGALPCLCHPPGHGPPELAVHRLGCCLAVHLCRQVDLAVLWARSGGGNCLRAFLRACIEVR